MIRTLPSPSCLSCCVPAVHLVLALGIWGGLLFYSAASTTWPRAWIHLALWLITFAFNACVLLRLNREVLAARLRPKRGTQRAERLLMLLVLPLTLAIPIVAGLDAVRYGWSGLPFWTVWFGVGVHAVGDALILWCMVVNPFLEKTVRIQADREHRVITTGPYAIVRHPMYSGVVLMLLAIPLVLGSAWTFVPVTAMSLLLMVRTEPEERMLRRELPGYEDYTHKTRWRMLPGIW